MTAWLSTGYPVEITHYSAGAYEYLLSCCLLAYALGPWLARRRCTAADEAE